MENNVFQDKREVQKLQNRVIELEQQLAEAQAAIQALSSSRRDDIQIEDAQQRAEELNAIVQTLHDPVMVYDQNGVIYIANASATRAHGFDPTRHHRRETNQTLLVRYPDGRIAHSDDLPSARALKGETVIDEALTITNSEGQELSILVTSSPLIVNGIQRGAVSVWHDITEHKRIEDARRESEAKYRNLVETAFEGIWVVDTKGHTSFVNRRMAQMLKYDSPNDLRDRSAFDFVPEEDLEELKANFQARLNENSSGRYDVRLRCRDGSFIWASVASNNLQAENGNLIGRMALFMEITERKEAEERLRSARDEAAWLARLPGENPNPVIRVSNEGIVLYCNPPAASLRGWRCALHEPLSRPLLDLVELAVAQGQAVEQDVSIGDKFYWVSVIPIPKEGYLNLYGRDITERQQAEKALAESERRQREITRLLELDQARLAAILQSLPVGVWIADQHGRLVGSNQAADRIWAGDSPLLNSTEEYPQYVSWYPESGQLLQAEEYPVAQALRTGQPVEPVELRIRRFDGTEGTVLVSAAPIKDNQGRLTGAVGVNVDITERKQAEQALRLSEHRLNRAQEIAHLGSWELDLVNNQLTWSDEVYRIFGMQPQEFAATYEAFLDAIHPEDRAAVDTAYSESIQTGRDSYEIEHRVINRSSGEVRIVHEKCEHFRNEAGQIVRSIGMVHDITERQKAEEALREAEIKYRTLVENIPNAVTYMASPNPAIGTFYVSPQIETMLGYTAKEWQANPTSWHECLHPEDQERLVASNARHENTGEPFSLEYRLISRDGRTVWLRDDAVMIRDSSGKPQFSQGIMIDITERKKAEEALRNSEERFSKAFHSSPDAIIISRISDGLIIEVNEGWRELFGHDPSEVIGRTSIELDLFVNPDDRKEAIRRLQEKGVVRNFQLKIRRKSGKARMASLSAEKIEVNGEAALLTVLRDITEQNQAEQALRESEERFRSLANSMPQLVWTALPDGTVDYYNQRYQEYQAIKKVAGKAWEWAPVLHPEDFQLTVDSWQHSLKTGEIYQVEHRVRMADGSYRWHLSRGVPMLDEQQRIVRWFGTATDIHDLMVAEEKLKINTERLERSNRELEQFAFYASHDLQEPLRKIEAYGALLLERVACLDEREREYVERMRSAASRMRDMVKGLLQLSRVTTQGKKFVFLDLSQVISEVLSDLESQIQETGGSVEVGTMPPMEGDPLQLRQLMQNLIGNALKYHQPGTPPVVKVHAKQLPGEVQILVEDKGIGFQQEGAERIFEPFQRLVGRSDYEGSGMGLAICRRIVERHRGSITAISQPGHGTTIVVTLPTHHQEGASDD